MRCVVVYGAAANDESLISLLLLAVCVPWIEWQLTHDTSTLRCLAMFQFSSCRCPAWQVRQTADLSAAVASFAVSALIGFAFIGSFRCSAALPWHDWQVEPAAS